MESRESAARSRPPGGNIRVREFTLVIVSKPAPCKSSVLRSCQRCLYLRQGPHGSSDVWQGLGPNLTRGIRADRLPASGPCEITYL
jgi:hypothetical protein